MQCTAGMAANFFIHSNRPGYDLTVIELVIFAHAGQGRTINGDNSTDQFWVVSGQVKTDSRAPIVNHQRHLHALLHLLFEKTDEVGDEQLDLVILRPFRLARTRVASLVWSQTVHTL